MTKTEQNRVVAWRLKLLHEASVMPRNVAQACRHFGLSRNTFYKWKARHRAHGEAGLLDRPRVPHRSPRATPREVVTKILYLRQRYHFGPGRIAAYLRRFHGLSVACSSVHRILIRHGMGRRPANQKRKPLGRAWQRYEKPQPGHRLQLDVKFLERIAGSRKVTAVDVVDARCQRQQCDDARADARSAPPDRAGRSLCRRLSLHAASVAAACASSSASLLSC